MEGGIAYKSNSEILRGGRWVAEHIRGLWSITGRKQIRG